MKALKIGLVAAALALGAGCMYQRVTVTVYALPGTPCGGNLTTTATQSKPITTNPAATVTAKGNTVPVSATPEG